MNVARYFKLKSREAYFVMNRLIGAEFSTAHRLLLMRYDAHRSRHSERDSTVHCGAGLLARAAAEEASLAYPYLVRQPARLPNPNFPPYRRRRGYPEAIDTLFAPDAHGRRRACRAALALRPAKRPPHPHNPIHNDSDPRPNFVDSRPLGNLPITPPSMHGRLKGMAAGQP